MENHFSKAPGARCWECPLKDKEFAPCEPAKTHPARGVIVSRSPGKYDTAAGRPFAGPSGKLLDHLLFRNGVQRSDVHTTNVVLCETETLDGEIGAQAIRSCAPRLHRELAALKAGVYIAAGAEALRALCGTGHTVRQSRGKRLTREDGTTVVGTYNPAAALRDDVVFPDLVQDFRRAFADRRRVYTPRIHAADDVRSASSLLARLREVEHGTVIAVDIETTGLHFSSSILSIGFSPSDTESFVIGRTALRDEDLRQNLSHYLSAREWTWVYHNGKFDVKLLRNAGINARVDEDTLLLSYCVDERPGVHSLDYLIQNELDWDAYEPATVAEGKKRGFTEKPITKQLKTKIKVEYEGFSAWEDLYKYNGYDTAGSRQVFGILSDRVESEGTRSVYDRLLIPASNCLADVEAYGVCFDVDEARRISSRVVAPELDRLHAVCSEVVGEEINLNSPQQVAKFLYDRSGIRNPLYRRGKDRSVDAATREEILRLGLAPPPVRKFIEHLDRYKKLDKLRGTYLDSLADRVDDDGRLRCDFLLHGTESGRLSSRGPNLQNVPRGGKNGLPNIRSLFVAPPGRAIISADYSQAELRTIAVTSGDEHLLEIYRSGKDLHDEVATELFGKGYSYEQRVIAKNYNFGIAYGQEAFSFHQMYHISREQARRDIDNWWSRFPGVRKWTREVHKETRMKGELYSAFGRKRRFPLITDDNLDHTLKEAVNFLIQSTASDFTLYSLIRLMNDGELDLTRAFPIILVHDSVVLEADEDYTVEAGEIVTATMASAPARSLAWSDIPFDADVQVGTTWGNVAA